MKPRLNLGLVGEVLQLADPRERLRLALYAIGSFLVSLTEVIGVAAVLPLVDIMTGAAIEEGYLGVLHRLLGEPSRQRFIIITAIGIAIAFACKALLGLAIQWWGSGVTTRLSVGLQTRLLTAFLREPYPRHRARNTSEVIRATGVAVSDAFGKVLGGALALFSEGLTVTLLLSLLLVIMPLPTLGIILYLGLSMFAIQKILARGNQQASHTFFAKAYDSAKALLDSFQGFREVRMLNREDEFLTRFSAANTASAYAQRKMGIFQVVPKYALELIAIVGIAALLAVMSAAGPQGSLLASIALFVAAAIRMLPSVVRITATLGTIRSGTAGAELAVATARELSGMEAPSEHITIDAPEHGDIRAENITFQFPDATEPVLRGVTVHIPAGTSVAFCGSSGSGKTTLVDVILGLQTAQEGTVTFSGIDIQNLGANWRYRIGYIPQDVYLLDASLAENVAFGLNRSEIDTDRLDEALRLARLDELVENMPAGVDTEIGERGTRLSGGQRQRLGIARALYSKPSVIVMDEATSALDNETEDQIIQTIHSLRGHLTTIMVAHRLSTVRDVDQLYFLEDGRVTATGTFDEVRQSNRRFSELVRLGDLTSPREGGIHHE